MRVDDLPAVERLAEAIHVDFPEGPEVFAERLALCPAGCWVRDDLAGYLVSHPWTLGAPPPLDTLLGALPAAPDTWYIHDLALAPSARGTGAAGAIVARLAAACALPTMSLIAVGASPPFWRRQGFGPVALPAGKLDSYGAGAMYMMRSLQGCDIPA
jgi:hypothetical protein